MEEGKNGQELKKKTIIFTQTIRAGKRTYFFDVKATRKNDLYLTITESRKRFNRFRRGFYFEQYKVFLYKEDFEKFESALLKTLEFIKENQGNENLENLVMETDDENDEDYYDSNYDDDYSAGDNEEDNLNHTGSEENIKEDYTDVKFEDLEGAEKNKKSSE
jgi:hypothetical protein